ncbi:64 protein [Seminavis robusta]|uniref:64 protein n=1 Tax=Seminavis robusta TaxID=568900 RepID=A0A9N8DRW7_9STRA|nr:64 protein [Seminavis robusta]CAB9505597.1 64 protein [Seminavis robusta]|eukprot:Sro236_g095120.1 64 protein (414) ;mRNA; f:76231-77551
MDCSSSGGNSILDDTASSDSYLAHHSYPDDSDDCCIGKSSSLEDTLSLTCDESLGSNLSSTFVADDDEDSSDCEDYPSPHLLRRRLMPIPPSPIAGSGYDTPIRNKSIPEARFVSRKRHSTRILWLMIVLIVYVILTTIDHGGMLDAARDIGISDEARQWRRFFRRRAPKLLHKIPNRASGRSYTIRIKGHRLDLVTQSLDYHAQCPSVKEVQVLWTDPTTNQLPKSISNHQSGKVQPLGKPSTMAVFLLDEDIRITCEEIERAFSEWREDPSRLVGFYPFQHTSEADDGASLLSPYPDFGLRSVSRATGPYSLVSDRAVFVHNSILRSLPSLPTACQDLSLSIIASSMTKKPPVAVLSNPHAIRHSKRSPVISNDQSRRCHEWLSSIGGLTLPSQKATIIGHEKRRLQENEQ